MFSTLKDGRTNFSGEQFWDGVQKEDHYWDTIVRYSMIEVHV